MIVFVRIQLVYIHTLIVVTTYNSGPVVNEMVKWMISDKKSVMVTYGGMSKMPIQIGTAPFIFRDLSLTGFWMTAWKRKSEDDDNLKREYMDMIGNLSTMIRKGELQMSYQLMRFGDSGQGMISGLKMATNEQLTADDQGHCVNVEANHTPPGVRGKVVMLFKN